MSAPNVIESVSRESLKEKLIEHLVKYCDCTEENARIAVGDFADPYLNLYLQMNPVPGFKHEFLGEQYELLVASTKEYVGNIHVKPQFTFFVFYRCCDVPNHTDEEYRYAQRIYMLTDLLPMVNERIPGGDRE